GLGPVVAENTDGTAGPQPTDLADPVGSAERGNQSAILDDFSRRPADDEHAPRRIEWHPHRERLLRWSIPGPGPSLRSTWIAHQVRHQALRIPVRRSHRHSRIVMSIGLGDDGADVPGDADTHRNIRQRPGIAAARERGIGHGGKLPWRADLVLALVAARMYERAGR